MATSGEVSRNPPRRGNAMVEFSLVFTILLTLVIGILEVGRTVWYHNTLAYAVRQATRYASVRSNLGGSGLVGAPDPIDAVVRANAPGLDPGLLTVTKTWTPDNSPGSQVKIRVSYPVDLIAASLFMSPNARITVSATSALTVLN